MNYKKLLKKAGLKVNRTLKGYELEGYVEDRPPSLSNYSVRDDGSWAYSNLRAQQVELYIPKNEKGKGYTDRAAARHVSSQKTKIMELGPARPMSNTDFYKACKSLEKELIK